MENITKKLHAKRVVLIVLVLLWMCVVFYLSSQNGDESASTSSQIINVIVNIYEKIVDKKLTIQNVENLSFIVRKFAHFTLYFLGAILLLKLLKTYNMTNKKIYIFTILFCFTYACSDEVHQLFNQGRNANIIDILIDTLGSTFGVMFLEIVSNIIYKSSNRRNINECN